MQDLFRHLRTHTKKRQIMDIDQLRKELEADEGVKKNDKGNHISYLCSENVVTGGIGHMITEWDDEKYTEIGV